MLIKWWKKKPQKKKKKRKKKIKMSNKKEEGDPENFCCGVCGNLVPYNSALRCSICEEQKPKADAGE